MTRHKTPKTITVANQKGGVGKSFIADELAWALERADIPFAFWDLDGQGGTCHVTSDDDARKNAMVNVVDTPGALTRQLHDLLQQTDVIVVPVRPNKRDVEPTECMMSFVERNCPDAAKVLVVNMWTRFVAARNFEQHVDRWREKGWHVFYVPQSEAVARAYEHEQSVVTFGRRSRVGGAVSGMCTYVIGQVM